MADRIRYGLVGTGMMGVEHIRNLAITPGAELVAIADPVGESLGWARDALGPDADRVTAYDSATALTAHDGLDAVIVATPNHTHRDVLIPLFDRGLHILCEKPLATTIDDALWIARQAADHPAVFWTAMEYRYMPPVAALIAGVHAGQIGRLRMLAMREHRFPFLVKVGDWNRFARNTGGTMVEKCCHFFDLMRLIVGAKPVAVYCSGGQDVNHLDEAYDGQRPDILDNSFTTVEFANGVRAMLDLCMFADGADEQEEIVATGDVARLDVSIPSGRLTVSPRAGRGHPKRSETRTVDVDAAALAAGSHHGATFYQHQAFARAVRGEGPVEVSADDGLRAVAMGVAAERSAKERRRVTMAEILPMLQSG